MKAQAVLPARRARSFSIEPLEARIAPAMTFLVTNTSAASVAGSLINAIEQANAHPNDPDGPDIVAFNIPGTGPFTIQPTGSYAITDPVVIDGFSQPGSSPNTLAVGNDAVLQVVINAVTPTSGSGLVFAAGAGGSTVRGLVLSGYVGGVDAIRIESGSNGNTIEGCFIGTDVTGSTSNPNNVGIRVLGSGTTIGGTSPAARNIISGNSVGIFIGGPNNIVQGNYIGADRTGTLDLGNSSNGVTIIGLGNLVGGVEPGAGNVILGNNNVGISIGGTSNVVQGNIIGLDVTGTVDCGNGDGISIAGSFNQIGGATASARNVISGNDSSGVSISGSARENVIQGNFIGTDATGVVGIGNSTGIIVISTATNNLIGGVASAEGNLIAFNTGDGVVVSNAGTSGIAIRGNAIFSNGGIGIDLNDDGLTANDASDSDAGSNNLQNFPALFSATADGGVTSVTGLVVSNPNRVLFLDFYASPAADALGYGEGAQFLGSTEVLTDVGGNAQFSTALLAAVPLGHVITATATTAFSAPFGDTSEFSRAVAVSAASAPRQVSIADATVVEGDAGVVQLAFAVTLSAASTQPVTVKYSTVDGSATSGVDFLAQDSIITFAPGETAKTVQVAVLADALDEADEILAVTLNNASGAAIGDAQAIGTITDDDEPPAFSVSDAVLREGDVGEATAIFNISLSAASGRETRIAFTTSEDTADASDFLTTGGTLVFAPGETSKTVVVPILGDRLVESDETFVLSLTTVTNASIGDASGVGLIQNDDSNIPPTIRFGSATSYDAGKAPVGMATGDLNGDGFLDLVGVNRTGGTLSVLIGDGTGTFVEAVSLPTGGRLPNRVAIGDFNEDGKLDLAVSNGGSKTIGVLLNNGAGVFGSPALFAAGSAPAALNAGDLNGDGNLDLVVTNSRNKICILPGNGDGAFGVGVKYSSGGTRPVDLGFGDFNGDGSTDIAVVNAGSKTVRLLIGNGAGVFTPSARFYKIGSGASGLAVGDFDGDGDADLAVAHTVSRFISVMLGRTGEPGMELNAPLQVGYPGSHAPRAISVVDIDGDGRPDLVLANGASGSFRTLLGVGNGTFRAPEEFAIDSDTKSTPAALALGDFDRDGQIDVAVSLTSINAIAVIVRG